jgi:acetolactate synthase I/II/III large subunit
MSNQAPAQRFSALNEISSDDVPSSAIVARLQWDEQEPASTLVRCQPEVELGAGGRGERTLRPIPQAPPEPEDADDDEARSSYVRLKDLLHERGLEETLDEGEEAAPMSAGRRIVAALLEAGIETFFGVPGGPISPLFEAVLSTPGARLIESRHESHAAFAAMGYYRATGRAAAVMVTAGPGATNAMTGVTAAFTERVPMLVLCGDVAWAATGGRMAQDSGPEGIAVERMFGRVTRAAVRASRPESAATQALAALHAAQDPLQPGPALFVLPMDIGRAAAPETEAPQSSRSSAIPAPSSTVLKAARWLAEAERPLVIVGAGARQCAAELRRVLDVLNVPFFTTPQAKGLVSEEHPHSLRHGGLAASWWARRYCEQGSDVTLVLGTDLDDSSVGPTRPIAADRPGSKLIHVDLDAGVFHRNYRADLPIVADLASFLAQLYDVVTIDGIRSSHGGALAREIRASSPFDTPDFATDESEIIAPHRAIADLERAAGPGARFVTDIGEHMLFALHYLTAKGPDAFTIHLGLGSMASGIGSAIGQSLADPQRRIVCICGDGGMQMAGMELLVATRERLPIVYAVFNDARYNMVYHGHKQLYGGAAAWSTNWVDFALWARSLGVAGARIERAGQITPKLLDLLTAGGPAVLDIRIDRDKRIQGAGRNEALQQMSMRSTGK